MTAGKWTLMVSHDVGLHYFPRSTAASRDDLLPEAYKQDAEGWRWYITTPDGGHSGDLCTRHAAILAFMDKIRRTPAAAEEE